MTQIETARRIQQTLQRTVADIRADTTLSEAGKTQRLTEAYQTAKSKMNAVRSEYSAAAESEYQSLRTAAFGLSHLMGATPADKTALQLAYRDALQRIEGLRTEADALKVLEQADLTGDKTLAKAVSLSAYKNGWGHVLAAYETIDKSGTERIYKLMDAEAAQKDTMHRMGTQMVFSLQKPPEVPMNAEFQPTPAAD